MGYDESDWIKCEVIGCEEKAVDIHHIDARGMGGTNRIETIQEIMGICRHHHIKYGDRTQYIDFLRYCHIKAMQERNVSFNHELIQTNYV